MTGTEQTWKRREKRRISPVNGAKQRFLTLTG